MRLGLAILALMATTAACTASGPDGDWQVVSLGTTAIEVADNVTLSLSEGQVSGRSGCNRIMGSYTVDGSDFMFGPLAGTRMACRGRAAEIEAQFNALAPVVTGWQRDGDTLVLTQGTLPVLRAVPQLTP